MIIKYKLNINIKNKTKIPGSYGVALYEMLPLDHKQSSVNQRYLGIKS